MILMQMHQNTEFLLIGRKCLTKKKQKETHQFRIGINKRKLSFFPFGTFAPIKESAKRLRLLRME